MIPEIISQKNRLDNLFKLVLNIEDEELQSHWARYLCVLVSGFVENSMKILINSYVNKMSHPTISNFVGSSIRGFANLNDEKIKQIIGSFNREWREELSDNLSEEYKEAIDAVVSNRNNIVHGKNVDITYHRLKPYYLKIWQLISIIHDKYLKG